LCDGPKRPFLSLGRRAQSELNGTVQCDATLPVATSPRYHHFLSLSPSSPRSYQPPWAGIVTIVPGLRGGRPVIRGMRITVGDVLGWLASGMSEAEILMDFPELTEDDIRAALAFAAERERSTTVAAE
jgi:uncharacterized protein (DUF433 family)